MIKKLRDFTINESVFFHSDEDILKWSEKLKDSLKPEIRSKINTLNDTYFRQLQRNLVRLFDAGEIDNSTDAEKVILKGGEILLESKKVLYHNEYDKYLTDKEYMKFFNQVKNKIIELDSRYNTGMIDLLIDKIYLCYTENYSVEDTVNKLYTSGSLYQFSTKGLDQ